MLSALKIKKVFGDRTIIDNISFYVKPGQIMTITGASGAGKTTLLNILAGVAQPTAGEVLIDDHKVNLLAEVAYMCAGQILLPSLTVTENMQFSGCKSPDELIHTAGLDKVKNCKPHVLSAGEYRRAALCVTLARDVDYYILDEPTSNLDAESAYRIRVLIEDIGKTKCIIVATHDPQLHGDVSLNLGEQNGNP